jgi:hypothetical protein
MTAVRQVFEFNLQDCMFAPYPPRDWDDFCRCIGVDAVGRFAMQPFAMIREAAKKGPIRGKQVRVDHSPFDDVTIIVTQPSPRISAKLAATFPWKLRKHLKQP